MLDRGIQPALRGAGALSPGREPRPGLRLLGMVRRFPGVSAQGAYSVPFSESVCRGPEDACRVPSVPGRLCAFDCGVTAVLGSALRPRAMTMSRCPGAPWVGGESVGAPPDPS